MNLRPVQPLKFLLSAVAVFAIAALTVIVIRSTLQSTPEALNGITHASMQMGYYDFMSHRSELYDADLKVLEPGVTLMVITNPEDEHFLLKGKFTRTPTEAGKMVLSYSPIYYSAAQQPQMIDGMLDFFQHQKTWRMSLRIEGEVLAVGQGGAIFAYPSQ